MKAYVRSFLTALALAALIASASAARGLELPENVFAPGPEDDLQDLLFLGETRPLFVRLHIRISGVGFHTAWSDFIIRLHAFLDGDGDGVVTSQEAQRGNWQQMVQSVSRPILPPGGQNSGRASAALDSDPKDGKVSLAELSSYIRTATRYDEFGTQVGPAADPKSRALLAHLDLDHDGALSAAELAADATERCLARLDLNDDELIDLSELRPYENAYADRFRGGVMAPASRLSENLVIILGPSAATSRLLQRLIGKYDRSSAAGPQDGRLSGAELGCSEETLCRFDTSGDGALDQAELTTLLSQPVPDLELNVALDPASTGGARIELTKKPRCLVLAGSESGSRKTDHPLTVDLGGAAVEFAVDDFLTNSNVLLARQFAIADSDQNGYVDKSEAAQPPALMQQVFAIADRDGDGKLYKKELEAYLARQAEAIASRVMLTVTDRGRTLFEMLDTDGDQKLGLRELRRAGQWLVELDRDGNGRLAEDEVPHRYRLGVGRGQAPLRRVVAVASYDASVPSPHNVRGGPEWFERMDRNQDGDVSIREFLGTPAQFHRFDSDGDRLIDVREANGKP